MRLVSRRHRRLASALCLVGIVGTAAVANAALVGLPPGQQVNNDPGAGISPDKAAGKVDVAAARTDATKGFTPWAAFEQTTAGAQQVFVREFVGGQWITRGNPASLNIDKNVDGEHPAIDLAGPNGTVPWVAWYERGGNIPGGTDNIFASRFSAAQNKWLPSGQDRFVGQNFPSLNIHTTRNAENPSMAAGNTTAGGAPEPWVTWQEAGGSSTVAQQRTQIFVSKTEKPNANNSCTANFPGNGAAVNGFCWQAVGTPRISGTSFLPVAATDPTLNVDVRRNAEEPDIAFTGTGDTVPWVVWHETGLGSPGLPSNDLVFAAKAVPDASAEGGFRWVAVGRDAEGTLDTAAACAVNSTATRRCSLNADSKADARNARVAAGSMAAGGVTVPWVAWVETKSNGTTGIFVSRLVGDRFVAINGGESISPGGVNATSPDITFSGNTPYITWREDSKQVAAGHLEGTSAKPVFVLDELVPAPDVTKPRAAVSSLCPATPLTKDGALCPGGAVGTPFTAFTDSTSGTPKLFGRAWAPGTPTTTGTTAVSAGSATFNGAVDPQGASAKVSFEFGPTTAYGKTASAGTVPATRGARAFQATATGLSGVVHFRAVVESDFGRTVGADQVVTVPAGGAVNAPNPNPIPTGIPNATPRITVAKSLPVVRARKGGRVAVSLRLRVSEASRVTVTAKRGRTLRSRVVTTRSRAGAFVVRLNLGRATKNVTFTVKIAARDAQGATSTVTRTVKVRVRR